MTLGKILKARKAESSKLEKPHSLCPVFSLGLILGALGCVLYNVINSSASCVKPPVKPTSLMMCCNLELILGLEGGTEEAVM